MLNDACFTINPGEKVSNSEQSQSLTKSLQSGFQNSVWGCFFKLCSKKKKKEKYLLVIYKLLVNCWNFMWVQGDKYEQGLWCLKGMAFIFQGFYFSPIFPNFNVAVGWGQFYFDILYIYLTPPPLNFLIKWGKQCIIFYDLGGSQLHEGKLMEDSVYDLAYYIWFFNRVLFCFLCNEYLFQNTVSN